LIVVLTKQGGIKDSGLAKSSIAAYIVTAPPNPPTPIIMMHSIFSYRAIFL